PAGGFQSAPLYAARLPRDDGPDASGVAPGADQLDTEPVVPIATLVVQQNRRFPVIRNEHVQKAVVVKVADSHPSAGKLSRENRARCSAYILKAVPGVLEHQQWFFV